jgi:hypothetical protein
MTKKKLIAWLSGIGDDETKIFFWDPGGRIFVEDPLFYCLFECSFNDCLQNFLSF